MRICGEAVDETVPFEICNAIQNVGDFIYFKAS